MARTTGRPAALDPTSQGEKQEGVVRVDLAGWKAEREHAVRLIWRIFSNGVRDGADRRRE
jgi:hypothetical protein